MDPEVEAAALRAKGPARATDEGLRADAAYDPAASARDLNSGLPEWLQLRGQVVCEGAYTLAQSAWDSARGRQVALKTARLGSGSPRSAVALELQALRVCQDLGVPVAAVLAADLEGADPYVVLERGGESLAALFRRGPALRERFAAVRAVARALEQLHSFGLVLGCLQATGVYKCGQEWSLFDVGALSEEGGEVDPVVVPRETVAPEVAAAALQGAPRARAAPAQDVWALGVVALQALSAPENPWGSFRAALEKRDGGALRRDSWLAWVAAGRVRVDAFSPAPRRRPGMPAEFRQLQQFAAAALGPGAPRPQVSALLLLLENFDPARH